MGRMITSSIQLPSEVWDFLKKMAEIKNTSVSSLVRLFISGNIKYCAKMSLNTNVMKISDINKIKPQLVHEMVSYVSKKGFILDETHENTRANLIEIYNNNTNLFNDTLLFLSDKIDYLDDIGILTMIAPEVSNE